jgi:hypothetical protein
VALALDPATLPLLLGVGHAGGEQEHKDGDADSGVHPSVWTPDGRLATPLAPLPFPKPATHSGGSGAGRGVPEAAGTADSAFSYLGTRTAWIRLSGAACTPELSPLHT